MADTMEHGRNEPYSLLMKSNGAMMNAISHGPVSLGRKNGGYGNEPTAATRLSYLPRNAHRAGFHSHSSCPAEHRSGQSCRQLHAPRTMLRTKAVQACPHSSSIRDMDGSC
jgi:hypothetical protein